MADTWDITDGLRPRARPDGLAPEPLRPHARPEAPQETASLEPDQLRPRTRPEGLGTVPEETQENATVAEALPLDRTTLIGLFNGPDGGSALLRLPGGTVVKVAAGGTVDGGRVTAISEDGLRLQKDGEEIILTMPG
jgi:Tfp pilus assembly protein PilP